MTTEAKARKNPDYSASAVNLTNSVQVIIDLRALKGLQIQIAELQKKIDDCIPQELKDLMSSLQTQFSACAQGTKSDIDTYGSYQDIEAGMYAVKQRKLSISYDASSFESHYPELAPAVLVKSVNIKAIEGLLKGQLLDKARLEAEGVLKISEAFAYVIKV